MKVNWSGGLRRLYTVFGALVMLAGVAVGWANFPTTRDLAWRHYDSVLEAQTARFNSTYRLNLGPLDVKKALYPDLGPTEYLAKACGAPVEPLSPKEQVACAAYTQEMADRWSTWSAYLVRWIAAMLGIYAGLLGILHLARWIRQGFSSGPESSNSA